MDNPITRALQQLSQLSIDNPDIKLADYEDSYNLILDALPTLGTEDVEFVSKSMLMLLTNENAGPVYMNQIPIDINGYLAADHLLSIRERTKIFVSLSDYFITSADLWIGEVYYYGYLLYACRQDYPLDEIKQGLLDSSSEAVAQFRAILKQLDNPTDNWEEGRNKLQAIIQLIDNELVPQC